MQVQPYLFFGGRCEEALGFYQKALGAEVLAKMKFKEAPDGPPPGTLAPGWEDKVMHSAIKIGEAQVMASDGMGVSDQPGTHGVSLALIVKDDAEARQRFDALAEGGQVQMPLGKTFFSSSFGLVADKFGVSWMVVVG